MIYSQPTYLFCFCRYEDLVKNFSVDYAPGGATQNSIRIAQVRKELQCIILTSLWQEDGSWAQLPCWEIGPGSSYELPC